METDAFKHSDYKYDAFISYRHIEPDKTIASRLQKMLEGYRAPREVFKKYGIKKINRIFRDRDELPTSGDLNADINEALKESRFLIVICSPDTPKSKWCTKEIETFKQLHRGAGILALLVKGEPEESFPDEIRYMQAEPEALEESNERIEVEPLAADIRSGSLGKSLSLLKNEKLRLLAPMLGCEYFELRQRQKERRLKQILAASLAATAVLISVGAVIVSLLFKLDESNTQLVAKNNEVQSANENLKQKNNQILINNSKYLTDEALKLYKDGDRLRAMEVVLEALPKDTNNPERPVVPEAQEALSAIVNGDDYATTVIHTSGFPRNAMVTGDGKYIVVEEKESLEQESVTVWNARNGSYITKLDGVPPKYQNAQITKDSKYVVMGNLYWDVATGKLMGEFPGGTKTPVQIDPKKIVSPEGTFEFEQHAETPEKEYVLLKNRLNGGEFRINCNYRIGDFAFFCNDTRLILSLIIPPTAKNSGGSSEFAVYDTRTGTELFHGPLEGSGFFDSCFCKSSDDELIAIKEDKDIVVFDSASMKETGRWKDAPVAKGLTRMAFNHTGNRLTLLTGGELSFFNWRNSSVDNSFISHTEPDQIAIFGYMNRAIGNFQFLSDDEAWIATSDSGYNINLTRGPDVGVMVDNFSLVGHKDTVVSVVFTPDNSHVVSASLDQTVRLWDIGRKVNSTVLDYKTAFPYINYQRVNIGDDYYLTPIDEQAGLKKYWNGWGSTEDYKSYLQVSVRERTTNKEISRINNYLRLHLINYNNSPMLAAELPGSESKGFGVEIIDLKNGNVVSKGGFPFGSAGAYSNNFAYAALYDDKKGTISVSGGANYAQKLLEVNVASLPGMQNIKPAADDYNRYLYWFDNGRILGFLIQEKLYTFYFTNNSLQKAYDPIDVSSINTSYQGSVTRPNFAWNQLLINDTLIIGSNGQGSGKTQPSITAYDMTTGRELFKKGFGESITSMYLGDNALVVQTTSDIDKYFTRLYALDPQTGEEMYSLNLDKNLLFLQLLPDGNFLYSLTDGTLYSADVHAKTAKLLTMNVQSASIGSVSKTGKYICLITDEKKIIYDLERDAQIAALKHVEDIKIADDEKGYIVFYNDYCGYVPFLDNVQLMDKAKNELAQYEVTLTQGEKEQFFIE